MQRSKSGALVSPGSVHSSSLSFSLMTKHHEIKAQSFGAHMSIAGGVHLAIDRGLDAGCDCLQIFVRNPRQWSAEPLEEDDVRLWKASAHKAGMSHVVAHASYLVNLASADPVTWNKSVVALTDELERARHWVCLIWYFIPGRMDRRP